MQGTTLSKAAKTEREDFTKRREEMIIQHLPLVNCIAQRIAKNLPAFVEKDDLTEAGIIGLVDAIDKFDQSKNCQFKTYAGHRIRGAILDSLRTLDWVPRSIRHKSSVLERARKTIATKNGSPALHYQIAEYLNISFEEYYRLLNECENVSLLSLDESYLESSQGESKTLMEIIPDRKQTHPAEAIDGKNLKNLIATEIERLPRRERRVLQLYYYKGIKMKEIGKQLRVTESRVSQIHSHALKLLRRRLKPLINT